MIVIKYQLSCQRNLFSSHICRANQTNKYEKRRIQLPLPQRLHRGDAIAITNSSTRYQRLMSECHVLPPSSSDLLDVRRVKRAQCMKLIPEIAVTRDGRREATGGRQGHGRSITCCSRGVEKVVKCNLLPSPKGGKRTGRTGRTGSRDHVASRVLLNVREVKLLQQSKDLYKGNGANRFRTRADGTGIYQSYH